LLTIETRVATQLINQLAGKVKLAAEINGTFRRGHSVRQKVGGRKLPHSTNKDAIATTRRLAKTEGPLVQQP